jgi:hypothetical protein
MAVTYINETHATKAGPTNTITVTFPGSISSGDTLLLSFWWWKITGTPTISISTGSWIYHGHANGTSLGFLETYMLSCTGTESGTFTVDWTTSVARNITLGLTHYSGMDVIDFDTATSLPKSTQTRSTASGTGNVANTFHWGVGAQETDDVSGTPQLTPDAATTLRLRVNETSLGVEMIIFDDVLSTTTVPARTWTWSGGTGNSPVSMTATHGILASGQDHWGWAEGTDAMDSWQLVTG